MLIRSPGNPADILDRVQSYSTLATLLRSRLLTVEAQICEPQQFSRNKHSGKIPSVIDARR
jgi:phenylacetate-CoA ligase